MSMELENWDITKWKKGNFPQRAIKVKFFILWWFQYLSVITALQSRDNNFFYIVNTLVWQGSHCKMYHTVLSVHLVQATRTDLVLNLIHGSAALQTWGFLASTQFIFAHRHRVSPVSSWYWIKFKYQSHWQWHIQDFQYPWGGGGVYFTVCFSRCYVT